MSEFLKGTYSVDKEIVDDKESQKDEFTEKALNSIGGSMVFVERNKMVWKGDEEDSSDAVNKS